MSEFSEAAQKKMNDSGMAQARHGLPVPLEFTVEAFRDALLPERSANDGQRHAFCGKAITGNPSPVGSDHTQNKED